MELGGALCLLHTENDQACINDSKDGLIRGGVADDIQHFGRRCGHGMGDDRFNDHQSAPILCWRKRGQQNEALGRSRGGFSTKIHAVCDSHGNPLRFILTEGQAADCRQAQIGRASCRERVSSPV